MSLWASKAITAWRLGLPNIIRVIFYRLSVLSGLNPVRRLNASLPTGPFFLPARPSDNPLLVGRRGWFEYSEAFGIALDTLVDSPPDWHINCLSGQKIKDPGRDWWKISDFDWTIGDIKTVWETSRFDWVLACVQQQIIGNVKAYDRLESWLTDWCRNNPPYKGTNWKCGQEASIRVMHLTAALLITRQEFTPTKGMLELIRLHLQRIAPTLQYAIAQDNNHGTSEASALFIGGSFLHKNGEESGKRWMELGRKYLENRAARLISEDGSFSQHSLNYHRLMLDSFSLVEICRRRFNLEKFNPLLYKRCGEATRWLAAFINPINGDGPNLGANDGARLLPLTDTDYRDYRPSVQLASVLFLNAQAFAGKGSWDQPLYWLDVARPIGHAEQLNSRQYPDGGYTILRNDGVVVFFRFPKFKFRPGQCDALHVDLWIEEQNWLRDAGTYSYNADEEWQNYFPSSRAHNTVQFDDSDQMPKIGRFLYSNWLQASDVHDIHTIGSVQTFAAAYIDAQEHSHIRQVELGTGGLIIKDTVSGFENKAVLRWRLKPGHWVLDRDKQTISCEKLAIRVSSSVSIVRIEICQGWESLYYFKKSELPVLEIEIAQAGELVSVVEWGLD